VSEQGETENHGLCPWVSISRKAKTTGFALEFYFDIEVGG